MKPTIRPAAPEDTRTIWDLNRDSLGYDYPLEATRERLALVLQKPANRVWVAELNGRVAGYIHAADYDGCYFGPMKDLIALAVSPDARGQGIGRELLGAAEDWAKQDGCDGIRLNSGWNRDGAHRFYEACGYHNRKDQKNYVKMF